MLRSLRSDVRSRRQLLAALLAVALICLVCGGIAGALWGFTAAPLTVQAADGGAYLLDGESSRDFDALGFYIVSSIALAIPAATALWVGLRTLRGPLLPVVAAVVGLGAASTSLSIGNQILERVRFPRPNAVAAGDIVQLPPRVETQVALVVFPLVMCALILVFAVASLDDLGTGRPGLWPTRAPRPTTLLPAAAQLAQPAAYPEPVPGAYAQAPAVQWGEGGAGEQPASPAGWDQPSWQEQPTQPPR